MLDEATLRRIERRLGPGAVESLRDHEWLRWALREADSRVTAAIWRLYDAHQSGDARDLRTARRALEAAGLEQAEAWVQADRLRKAWKKRDRRAPQPAARRRRRVAA